MKHTDYYKSGQHKINALKAQERAREATALHKKERIDAYNTQPNRCKNCDSILDYSNRKNKFCCRSCSAQYNNKNRPPKTKETRSKISETMSGRKFPGRGNNQKSSKIEWHTCKVCEKIFYTKTWSSLRITCGAVECKTHASVGIRPYTNGRRKIFYYFNKTENKEVLLESSWELDLAVWLDEHSISWIRPSPIKWFDPIKNKIRLYYPDFFLTEKGLYLDPKNPTALKLDKTKMEEVSKIIPILYGDLNTIKKEIF